MASEFIPLRDIPISIVVDEVVVQGEVESLIPADMSVVITAPATGLGALVHVPYLAMGAHALATYSGRQTRSITPHGGVIARWLLARIYAYSRGKRGGWGVHAVQRDGTWIELPRGTAESGR